MSAVQKMTMRNTTERVNRYFFEGIDNIEDVPKERLLFFLSTVFVWYDLEIEKRHLPTRLEVLQARGKDYS